MKTITNREAEILRYKAELQLCEFLLKKTVKIDCILHTNEGELFTLDMLANFPFSLKNEMAILLADAIQEYTNIINQIKTTHNEQQGK
jgi:hypothetical protein